MLKYTPVCARLIAGFFWESTNVWMLKIRKQETFKESLNNTFYRGTAEILGLEFRIFSRLLRISNWVIFWTFYGLSELSLYPLIYSNYSKSLKWLSAIVSSIFVCINFSSPSLKLIIFNPKYENIIFAGALVINL